jgi:hypothetical protein
MEKAVEKERPTGTDNQWGVCWYVATSSHPDT